MQNQERHTHEGHGYRKHQKGKEHGHHHGPKTFRRGRAIAFLERMQLKRSTIKEQLDKPEFQSIQQVLVGELKAVDMMINEFVQLFDIDTSETEETECKREKNHGGSDRDENSESVY